MRIRLYGRMGQRAETRRRGAIPAAFLRRMNKGIDFRLDKEIMTRYNYSVINYAVIVCGVTEETERVYGTERSFAGR